METKLKHLVFTVILAVVAFSSAAQAPTSTAERKAALLTPEYYTNWIGASFFTIAGIERDLDVTPAQIIDQTFFYDFGTCFVGMEANEKGVIIQMTIRLFGDEAGNFITKALEYGYEKIGKGTDVNVRSNSGKVVPEVYDSKVTRYCKTTENGKVYLEVSNSERFANEYNIAIYRSK